MSVCPSLNRTKINAQEYSEVERQKDGADTSLEVTFVWAVLDLKLRALEVLSPLALKMAFTEVLFHPHVNGKN